MKSKKSFALLCALIISLLMSSSFAYAADNQYVENTEYQTLLDDCEVHIYNTNGGGSVEFVDGNWPSSVFPQMTGHKTFRAVANEGWQFAGWSHRISFDGTFAVDSWEKENHSWLLKTAFNVNNDVITLERGATVGEVVGSKLRYYAYANFNPIITTTAGENGSITPTGPVTYGESKTIQFTPNQHYVVDQVTVDGIPTNVEGDTYTFTNVTRPHSISVTFKYEHALQENVTKAATCTEEGEKEVTCKFCDYREVFKIAPLGHDIQDGERVEPTCTEDGYAVGKCARLGCDYMGKTILQKLGHDMKVIESKAATCTEDGFESKACQNPGCTETDTAAIPKMNHHMKIVESKAATCTEDGFETKVCQNPGCTETVTTTIPKLAHDFGEWITTIEPQIGVKGLQERECAACHIKESRELPALIAPPVNPPVDPPIITPVDPPVDPDPVVPVDPQPEPEPLPDDEHLEDPDQNDDDFVKPTLPEDEHLDLDKKDVNASENPDQPKTGDEQQTTVWFALLLLALAALGVTIRTKKRTENE